jgi:hypothetical protein
MPPFGLKTIQSCSVGVIALPRADNEVLLELTFGNGAGGELQTHIIEEKWDDRPADSRERDSMADSWTSLEFGQ